MDSTAISLLALVFSFLAVLATIRLRKPRHDPSDQHISGDCPRIPSDFKVSHGKGK